MTGTNGLCWDSCIFSAILKGEDSDRGELDILRQRIRDFNDGELTIIASTLLLVEVRQSKLKPDQMQTFTRIVERSNLILVDVNTTIALRVAQLRNELHTDQGKHLSTPDAIHVATAVEFKVEM